MRLLRWLRYLVTGLLAAVLVLLFPVAWVETACRGTTVADDYVPILPAEARRPEARSLMTYPEWHIVHAYEDYAEVIRTGDPHDFAFVPSIAGFWGSLCALSRETGAHGGFDWPTKRMVYTIGVSFTAELGLKAAYEETIGRIATLVRGDQRAVLDDLSARQALAYATFLQQVPWHQWDFTADADALTAASTGDFRDTERRIALGLEFRAKAAYAKLIAAAVVAVGPDALTMRVIVTGLTPEVLSEFQGVTVIATRPEGVEIETPRYRAFTDLAGQMAAKGGSFVEIAGNDDILYTALSPDPTAPGALHSFVRQGFGDYRHVMLVKVSELAGRLNAGGIEHVHDY